MNALYPLYDFGGNGPLINLAVANGFPPQVYTPLVAPLLKDYHVVSLLPRALWPDEKPPAELRKWDMVADDLLAGFKYHGFEKVIAVGHSFGGVASLLAAVNEPKYFQAVCLLDPTIFPTDWMKAMAQAQADGTINNFPLAQGALRRRRVFESVDAAYAYFKSKTLFTDWPEESLRLYAETGTRPTADGQNLELTWPPEWEAYYFMTGYTDTWEMIPRLHPDVPLCALRGANTDTFTEEAAGKLRGLVPHLHYIEIPGGHLFPQTAPQETAAAIQRWLAKQS